MARKNISNKALTELANRAERSAKRFLAALSARRKKSSKKDEDEDEDEDEVEVDEADAHV